jgi:hypothetical protein
MQISRVIVALVALGALGGASACAPPRPATAPGPATDPSRLSHAGHAQIACADCHRGAARPGTDDHRPCDDGACHRKDFTGPPTLLCAVCHVAVRAAPLSAPLRPYPIDDAWQAQPSRFSHLRHLDRAAMEDRVGFHVTCTDCHTRGDAGLARPDHATCTRCHAPEVALAGAPAMTACAGCHEPTTRLRARRRLIRDDLHFDHARHRSDTRGQAIRCEECHADTERAAAYDDHAAPRVERCVTCHDDSARTPPVMRMRICETCHRQRSERLTSLAPRSHLPLTERPLDHTLAFRRDHAEAAAHDGARCAACHTQMSGNAAQVCDECHQTMSPSDHRLTWREFDHGSEAAADRERCARCHVVEFCTSCHRQRPRSHGFIGSFQTDHAKLARINIRPCLTCHSASFCAPCHDAPAARRGGP